MSDNLFSLTSRVALVTGASSGIGRHVAGVLAQHGASTVVTARRGDALDAVVAEIKDAGGRATALVADLGAPEDAGELARRAAEPFGAPDILINTAGMNPRKHADHVTPEVWQQTLDLNLAVPFFLAQALVPGMREKGQGNIINVASLQSYRAFANGLPYGASKGGIVQLTRAMAEAWSADGITVNAIAPGFFPTELTGPVFDDDATAAHHASMTAIGRNGRMEDLDGVTVFLASRASAYITGQVIAVDGGYTAK
ncbi:MAG: SDR family NAD(P)-dependent oxidoreductase [Hyphomicrobiaceae bacterium]